MVAVQGGFRPWRRCGGLRKAALDFARRCDPLVYLSNLEKQSLFLTGFNDVPPWVVQEALEQVTARGSYVPGEEALRLRLADALSLEDRLAADLPMERETEDAAATEEATTEAQEPPEEPPAGQWRSPLETVQEGAEEAPQEPPGEEGGAPAAVDRQIEDRDFSSFSKTQLVSFAADQFGVELKRWVSRDELIATVQRLVDEANEKVV